MSYTEAQIREAMKKHRPGNEGYCVCAWDIDTDPNQEFDADHLIDVLKKEADQWRCTCPGPDGAQADCPRHDPTVDTGDPHWRKRYDDHQAAQQKIKDRLYAPRNEISDRWSPR